MANTAGAMTIGSARSLSLKSMRLHKPRTVATAISGSVTFMIESEVKNAVAINRGIVAKPTAVATDGRQPAIPHHAKLAARIKTPDHQPSWLCSSAHASPRGNISQAAMATAIAIAISQANVGAEGLDCLDCSLTETVFELSNGVARNKSAMIAVHVTISAAIGTFCQASSGHQEKPLRIARERQIASPPHAAIIKDTA